MKASRTIFYIAFAALVLTLVFSCKNNISPKQQKYVDDLITERAEKDNYMKDNPSSPFNARTKIEFHPLQYFEPDPAFVFKSKFFRSVKMDTVTIFGTKGEPREVVRVGYVVFRHDGIDYKVNIYEGRTRNGVKYNSIWFTDKTTNEETYGVGRYIDFELFDDPEFEYTIDFNRAYNPYCAYSPDYSCAIPTKEDYLDLAVTAGKKKFHDESMSSNW